MRNYIVDSYAWVKYFQGDEKYRKLMEENLLKTPSIVLAEIARSFLRKGLRKEDIKRHIDYICERSLVLILNMENAAAAGEIAEKEGLYLIDAIVYCYATEQEKLLTGDRHFKGKRNVEFLG